MIENLDKIRKFGADINEQNVREIRSYIQGAVYCWCKNRREPDGLSRWFAARDLFGGANRDWEGTPLYQIFEWYKAEGYKDPEKEAGIDVGRLLKEVLHDDKRVFQIGKNYTLKYRWMGK